MREVCAEFLGEVTEWPNVRDWKSRVGQKPTGGSNPPLSAFVKAAILTQLRLFLSLEKFDVRKA